MVDGVYTVDMINISYMKHGNGLSDQAFDKKTKNKYVYK